MIARKKLFSLLKIPVAVGIIGSGVVTLVSHQANAQAATPQSAEQSADKPELGDTPDKPGEVDTPDKPGQSDGETQD
jgi:hypothetical protein